MKAVAREVGRLVDGPGPDGRPLVVGDGAVDPDHALAGRTQTQVGLGPGAHAGHDPVGGGAGPGRDLRGATASGRAHGDVDQVLVHPDRRDGPVRPSGELGEQAIVDRDLADLAHSGATHVSRQGAERAERPSAHARHVLQGVRVVVVGEGEGERAVPATAQPEAEVARGDEGERRHPAVADPPDPVDRRHEPSIRTQRLERRGAGEELRERPWHEQSVRVALVDRLAGLRRPARRSPTRRSRTSDHRRSDRSRRPTPRAAGRRRRSPPRRARPDPPAGARAPTIRGDVRGRPRPHARRRWTCVRSGPWLRAFSR